MVDIDLHPVDCKFVGGDTVDQVHVYVLERMDRPSQLGFDEAAHGHHARADLLHLRVELLVSVVTHAGSLMNGYPNLPVM